MPELHIPIDITYQTSAGTPIKDVLAALQATDLLVQDSVALLPSLIPNVDVTLLSVGIRRLSQESPLKEIIVAAIFVTAQQSLEAGVIGGIEMATGWDIPEKFDSLLTIVVLVVLFYGASLAKDLVAGTASDGPAKRKLNALVEDLAAQTGRTQDEVRRVIDAKYAKPGPVKTLITSALGFFRPSHREGSAPILIGETTLEQEVVSDVPLSTQVDPEKGVERFQPHNDIVLELHAQDRDRSATGWAAVPRGISDRRIKMKVMPPLEPSAIWGKETVRGDIVLISRLTSGGYEPNEIHLTAIRG